MRKSVQIQKKLSIQSIQHDLKSLDTQYNNQNLNAIQLSKQNYRRSKTLVKILIDYIKQQHKLNKQMEENRQYYQKSVNNQIKEIKEIVMRKMELIDLLDQKIQKKNRQTQEKFCQQIVQMNKIHHTLYEETLAKKLMKLNQQIEQIQKKIFKMNVEISYLDQNLINQSLLQNKIQGMMFQQSILRQKYHWIFDYVDISYKVFQGNHIITALEDNTTICSPCTISRNIESKFKIDKLAGYIGVGIFNAPENKYLFYDTNGLIFNDFNIFKPKTEFVLGMGGDTIEFLADKSQTKFTWNIQNPNTKTLESKNIILDQNINSWALSIYFRKKGDSLILLK